MAEVFRRVGGKKLTKIVALHRTVQSRLDQEAVEGAYRAEAELIQHRQDGHASIDVEEGKVDRYVVLDDERGLKAALSIEYGRKATGFDIETGDEYGGMEGLFILHRAMGLDRGGPVVKKGGDSLDE
jgi:hypothetical protein